VRRSLSDPFAPSPRATANATAADPGGAATTSRTVALRGAGSQAAHAGIVARSRAMRSVLCALDRMRDSELPVVICGETGTGKELVARVLHAESPRFAGPFRVLDCATIRLASSMLSSSEPARGPSLT